MTKIYLTGINILIEKIDKEMKSKSGLVMPESKDNLVCGRVVQIGPGFLLPQITNDPAMDDLANILGESNTKPKFIPLDIKENDVVYYHKDAGEEIYLNGKLYVILPYVAIKLFTRDDNE